MFEKINYPSTFGHPRFVRRKIQSTVDLLRKRSKKGLHVGCGFQTIEGMINCDFYNPNADLKANAFDLNMFQDGEVDLIESNHMIEHLSFADTEKAIAEWSRVTAKDGMLIVTFPDLTAIALLWIRLKFFNIFRSQESKLDYVVQMLVGSQENEGMFHRNAFDLSRMSRILEKYGYLVEYTYSHFPKKPTPSRLIIARKQ